MLSYHWKKITTQTKVTNLQSLAYSLKHVGDDGVIPEVSEPNPGSLHVHGTWQKETRSCMLRSQEVQRCQFASVVYEGLWISLHRCDVSSPMVTSEELWLSRKRLRWCQTRGTQSMIFTSSVLRVRLPISISISFLLRWRPRNPFTGSMWLAHRTHLLKKFKSLSVFNWSKKGSIPW